MIDSKGFKWGCPASVEIEDGYLNQTRARDYLYYPLTTHSGLFREFADLPFSEDAICSFALKYGMLTRWSIENDSLLPGPFESLELLWFKNIQILNILTKMWEANRSPVNVKVLREILQSKELSEAQIIMSEAELDKMNTTPLTVRDVGYGDYFHVTNNSQNVVALARRFIIDMTNLCLEGVTMALVFDEEKQKIERHFRPTNLLGAIYSQFAEAVAADKDYGTCQSCGKWFEISPMLNRTNKKYCSDACRLKVFRGRKKIAVAMAAAGKTHEEIAEELDVKMVTTVENWINEARSK